MADAPDTRSPVSRCFTCQVDGGYKENKRERFVSPEETERLGEA